MNPREQNLLKTLNLLVMLSRSRQQFSHDDKIGNRPILKIIQGRVNVKGNTGKK